MALPTTAAAWYGLYGRHWQHAGFMLAVVLLLTLPLLTPLLVRELCVRIRVRGFGLGYSLKGLGVRLQTTSVAVASLAVAVSMLIGITLMIGSFRQDPQRVDRHLDSGRRVHRPGFVARHRERRRPGNRTSWPPSRATRRCMPSTGCGAFTATRATGASPFPGVEMGLAQGLSRFPFLPGALPDPYEAVRERRGVFIGETLARKADVWVGDALPISRANRGREFSRRGRVLRLQRRRRRRGHGPCAP